MSKINQRLAELGIILPEAEAPAANYVPFKICQNLIYVSGQLPIIDGKLITGKVGEAIDISIAYKAARACGLSIIAQLNKATDNNLDKIKQIVKLGGFVNCKDSFSQHPEVINGASDLMVEVFGNIGRHSRFAIGSNALPRGVSVEIDAIAEIK